MRAVGAQVVVFVTRVVRDRVFLFFMLVLPTMIIALIGITIRQSDLPVGLVDADGSSRSADVVARLTGIGGLDLRRYPSQAALVRGIRRNEVLAGVVVPAGYADTVALGAATAAVDLVGDLTSDSALAVRSQVAGAVAQVNAELQAAQFAGGVDANLTRVRALTAAVPAVALRQTVVDAAGSLPQGFGYTAPSNLVLFVFVNAVAGGGALVELRRLGLARRMLAAPVPLRAVLAGQTAGYFLLSAAQGLLIFGLGTAIFGVDWGNPAAALVLILTWALVGTGAGMLTGSLLRTPEQASSVGPIVGMVAGMLGGCMWPLEIVGPAMRRIGHLTPHAWAMDGFVKLIARNGSLADIAPQLAVLGGFAAVFLVAGVGGLRRSLVGGS